MQERNVNTQQETITIVAQYVLGSERDLLRFHKLAAHRTKVWESAYVQYT